MCSCFQVCCGVLQCVAVRCSMVQYGAVCCSMLQCVLLCVAACCFVEEQLALLGEVFVLGGSECVCGGCMGA